MTIFMASNMCVRDNKDFVFDTSPIHRTYKQYQPWSVHYLNEINMMINHFFWFSQYLVLVIKAGYTTLWFSNQGVFGEYDSYFING